MAGTLKNILFIDDEELTLEMVKDSLEAFSQLTVHTTSSGRTGVMMAEMIKPDLILLDVMMPEVDGLETLQLLKQSSVSHVPVVFMTIRSGSEDKKRYHEMGAADVIPKPFDPFSVAQHIHEIWKKVS